MQTKMSHNRKSTRTRLLTMAVALSLYGSWSYEPAHAADFVVPEGTTVNGQVLSDRQTQTVCGSADNTTLNNSSAQMVYGRAKNTTLNDNSFQHVITGGMAEDTTLYDLSNQMVQVGGIANRTTLEDKSAQFVYGTANHTILQGDSFQWVEAEGSVSHTTLNDTSTQYLYGTANHTTLNDSSWQVVVEGVTANDTMLNDTATQYLYGTANHTQLNDAAKQYLFDTANRTIVTGNAEQYVYGTANRTSLHDSSWQHIDEGGTASRTRLHDNANQYVFGTADRTTLNDKSYQGVYGSGVVSETVLNNQAQQWIGGNGVASETVLYDASRQYVAGNGRVYRTVLNDQSMMAVEGGATAYDTTVNEGTVYIKQSSVLKNDDTEFAAAIKINSGGTLAVVEDGAAIDGHVAMNGGSIAFLHQDLGYPNGLTATGSYKNLTIDGDLTGGGQLAMNTNVIDGSGDRLIINGNVTGSYQVGFTNDATAAADGSESVREVIQPGGGAGVFSGEAEYGGYVYELEQNLHGHWDLIGTGKASSSGSASYNTFSASYLLNYVETTTLYQRLGDLRRGEVAASPWARVYGGRFSVDPGRTVSGYGMSYRGIQIGGDYKQELPNERGTIYTGGMLGYTTSGQSYQSGDGSVSSTTLGLYRTHVDPKGRYTSMVAKYGWMNNDYKVLDTASTWVEGSLGTQGPSLSVEAGQRLYTDKINKKGWYMEPQAQLSFSRQSGGSFTASNGLSVNVDDHSSVLGRLGMVFGREILQASRPVNAYAKVSYIKEFSGDIGFSLNGSPTKENLGSTWWSYGAGVAAQLNNDNNLYLDITRATGGNFTQCWQLNFGIRGQFN